MRTKPAANGACEPTWCFMPETTEESALLVLAQLRARRFVAKHPDGFGDAELIGAALPFAQKHLSQTSTGIAALRANISCDFAGNRALPALTVDEPIYRRLPTRVRRAGIWVWLRKGAARNWFSCAHWPQQLRPNTRRRPQACRLVSAIRPILL
jgi:hypothetical protein